MVLRAAYPRCLLAPVQSDLVWWWQPFSSLRVNLGKALGIASDGNDLLAQVGRMWN